MTQLQCIKAQRRNKKNKLVMREEELSFSSLLGRGIDECHYLSSSPSTNEHNNANVVDLLENEPTHYEKTQNEKAQREKDEKMFNMYNKKIKQIKSLIDENDSIVNNNKNKRNALDEKYLHATSQLLNDEIVKDYKHNDNNDFLMNDSLSWMMTLLLNDSDKNKKLLSTLNNRLKHVF